MQNIILGFGNSVPHGGWKVWLCLPLLRARCPEQAHPWRISFWKEEVMSHEVPGCDGWHEIYYSKTLRLGEEKRIWSKEIYLPSWLFHSCFQALLLCPPINLELETCCTWWQKNKKSRGTVPTSLKMRSLAWRMQISATGRNWTAITHMLHIFII